MMRALIILSIQLFIFLGCLQSQSNLDCETLLIYVETNGEFKKNYSNKNLSCSSFLNSVEFYTISNINTNDVQYYAICKLNNKKYIYSSNEETMKRWYRFSNSNQCGEAWHEYIKPYKLDCKNN